MEPRSFRHLWRRRTVRHHQPVFGFVERATRRERAFKRTIVLATAVAIIVILKVVPWGQYLTAAIATEARRLANRTIGRPLERQAIDEAWKNSRRLGIAVTRRNVKTFYAASDPAFQRLLRYAGMDPDHGLLRWGNFNWTLLLSSKVFEPDDEGRSYRMRPGVRSVWLRGKLAAMPGTPAFYLVPDGPGLAEALQGSGVVAFERSRQATNSWGLRGPEPNLHAPVRGLVLGDSYMQGMFIGDDETPPECLRRYLDRALATRVSILNTGVMGYSPEQYYHSLIAFAGRFSPHFVVVSVYANDCGNEIDATGRGEGNWLEGKYWLDRIVRYCRERRWPCLTVPAPYEYNLLKRRKPAFYPGAMVNLLDLDSVMYLDPSEDFLNAHLRSLIERRRRYESTRTCVLFNDDIGDSHFSPAGAELWAESVGRRLVLVMEKERAFRETSGAGPEPRTVATGSSEPPTTLASRRGAPGNPSPANENSR
ncbi:MAG: SGNH/GDSL hydrolase family protein [Isosphaeraceae bacterium]